MAYLFERGDVGREVRVADLAVEVDDEFELADCLVEMARAEFARRRYAASTVRLFPAATVTAGSIRER